MYPGYLEAPLQLESAYIPAFFPYLYIAVLKCLPRQHIHSRLYLHMLNQMSTQPALW